jgi:hypothetical protein
VCEVLSTGRFISSNLHLSEYAFKLGTVKVGYIRALLERLFFTVFLCAHKPFVEPFLCLSELRNSDCRIQDSHKKGRQHHVRHLLDEGDKKFSSRFIIVLLLTSAQKRYVVTTLCDIELSMYSLCCTFYVNWNPTCEFPS